MPHVLQTDIGAGNEFSRAQKSTKLCSSDSRLPVATTATPPNCTRSVRKHNCQNSRWFKVLEIWAVGLKMRINSTSCLFIIPYFYVFFQAVLLHWPQRQLPGAHTHTDSAAAPSLPRERTCQPKRTSFTSWA